MSRFKVVLAVLGGLAAILALVWIVQGNQFFLYKFFAPKMEEVRREVFEQTKSYRQGTIQEMQNWQIEYVQADESHKDALADVILRRAADFPEADMPPELRTFIQELRSRRMR